MERRVQVGGGGEVVRCAEWSVRSGSGLDGGRESQVRQEWSRMGKRYVIGKT